MENLSSTAGLVISQKKEWGEIFTGFETCNAYEVSDMEGRALYAAAEEPGSVLLRWFLKAHRPFTMVVAAPDGTPVIRVQRPFRFYFHTAEITDATGEVLGVVEKRFSVMRRVYTVRDPAGREAFQLFGPILHPWTFEIRQQGQTVGKITKKWSGLMQEGFSDADNFGVTFPAGWDIRLKALFLGSVFLIDFVHFENKTND